MGRRASSRTYDERRISRIMNFLAAHVSEQLTLQRVGRECGLSASTVQRLLQDKYGVGFRETLEQIRIAKLLSTLKTDEELKDEALLFATGWRSRTTLYAATRRVTGHSLRELRENPSAIDGALYDVESAACRKRIDSGAKDRQPNSRIREG